MANLVHFFMEHPVNAAAAHYSSAGLYNNSNSPLHVNTAEAVKNGMLSQLAQVLSYLLQRAPPVGPTEHRTVLARTASSNTTWKRV